jgi:hypothetical protein
VSTTLKVGAGVIYGTMLKILDLFLIQLLSVKRCEGNLGKLDDYAICIKSPNCEFLYNF